MTYEQRMNAIGTLLRETILPRYRRPEHLDDATARAELADMVSDLNGEWPIMGEQKFAETGDRLAKALRLTHTSRTWPTIAALSKALKAALEPPKSASAGDGEYAREAIYGLVLDWWRQFRGPLPSTATAEHAIRLQREGHATWGELRRSGFTIPDFARAEAMSEPDPNHAAIMAEIRALGERVREGGFDGKGDISKARVGA